MNVHVNKQRIIDGGRNDSPSGVKLGFPGGSGMGAQLPDGRGRVVKRLWVDLLLTFDCVLDKETAEAAL